MATASVKCGLGALSAGDAAWAGMLETATSIVAASTRSNNDLREAVLRTVKTPPPRSEARAGVEECCTPFPGRDASVSRQGGAASHRHMKRGDTVPLNDTGLGAGVPERTRTSDLQVRNLTLYPLSYGHTPGVVAEREGFEPSEEETPFNGLANRRTRPLCDLSSDRGR
jgi:hypothetical protein